MALFSERMGYVEPRDLLQLECAGQELRTGIYNTLHDCLGEFSRGSTAEDICKQIWTAYWHLPIDSFPRGYWEFYEKLLGYMLNDEWYVTYDLIEFVYAELGDLETPSSDPMAFDPMAFHCMYGYPQEQEDYQERFAESINALLETEGSGYRLIEGKVVPITNEIEIASIESCVESKDATPGASEHVRKALELLSLKPTPDLLNSVKESISAAESAAKAYAPGKSNTLAEAVTALQTKKGLHKSLAEAWKRMFGYTSDADGIRHAGSDLPVELDYAFARYMLVTCSAFANYLTEEYGQDE